MLIMSSAQPEQSALYEGAPTPSSLQLTGMLRDEWREGKESSGRRTKMCECGVLVGETLSRCKWNCTSVS